MTGRPASWLLRIAARGAVAAVIAIGLPESTVRAQSIQGRVRTVGGNVPVPGATVAVSDIANAQVARTTTSDSGTFFLRLPWPGQYTLRTLRIGFVPAQTGPIRIDTGETRSIDLSLAPVAVSLGAAKVFGNDKCHLRGDEAETFLGLWGKARAAIAAAAFTSEADDIDVHVMQILGKENLDSTERIVDSTRTRETIGGRVFASTPVDTLIQAGYVRLRGDSAFVFDAPSAEALLSDQFAATHCFGVHKAPGEHND